MYQGSLLEISNSVLPRVEKLSLVSFNCKGFNNGLSFLPVLLDSFDVVLLQERWLSDSELDRLCFDGFINFVLLSLALITLCYFVGILMGVVPYSIVRIGLVPSNK